MRRQPSIDPDAPAVDVRALVKRYGEVEALRGIDLTISPRAVSVTPSVA